MLNQSKYVEYTMNAVFSHFFYVTSVARVSRCRFCQSPSQSDICRFRQMTLLHLHLVANWQVFTINSLFYYYYDLFASRNASNAYKINKHISIACRQ